MAEVSAKSILYIRAVPISHYYVIVGTYALYEESKPIKYR